MNTLNKYFKLIFIIALISLVIFSTLYIHFILIGKVYININDNNKEIVTEMLESNNISPKNQIKKLGKMQGLGEWHLYFEYIDYNEESIILNDGEARDLYKYIGKNGYLGGTYGLITQYALKICIIIILIYIFYVVCHSINKKTNNIIEK